MRFTTFVTLTTLASLAAAAPVLEERALNCDNPLVDILKKDKNAVKFCSKYLGTATVTKTVTTKSVVVTTSTLTPDPAVTFITSTFTDCTTTVTAYPTAPNTFRRRAALAAPAATLAPRAGYPPPQLSSACSCIVTARPTATYTVPVTRGVSTSTTIVIGPAPPPFTVTETVTSCSATSAVPGGPAVACGVPGCATGIGYIRARTNEDTGVASCLAACRDTAGCRLVQFGTNRGSTVCSLYDASIEYELDRANKDNPDCQKFKFYDVRCTA